MFVVCFVDGEPASLGREQIMRRDWMKDESKIRSILSLLALLMMMERATSFEVFVGIEGTQSDPIME